MRGFLLVFSLHGGAGGPAAPGSDAWFGQDKARHFFLSAFTQSIGYGTLRGAGVSHGAAIAGASVATTIAGVGKEVRDRRVTGQFSPRDLVWDAAGAGAMSVMLARSAR